MSRDLREGFRMKKNFIPFDTVSKHREKIRKIKQESPLRPYL